MFYNQKTTNNKLVEDIHRFEEINEEIKQANYDYKSVEFLMYTYTVGDYYTIEESKEKLQKWKDMGLTIAVFDDYEDPYFASVETASQQFEEFLSFTKACADSGGGMEEYYD